jgi:glutathione S-transferase
MSMKLFGTFTSPYVRKVRVVALEKHIEFEFVTEGVAGEAAVVNQHNPLGKIPALALDDGFNLFDSPVIVEYLDDISPVGHLIPDGGRERALVKRWEALADGMLDAGVLVFLENRRPENERSPAWIEKQMGKIDRSLAFMSQELGKKNYCMGEALTLADVAVGCALFWLAFRFPELEWRNRYPNLHTLAEKLAQRKSFQETIPKV